MLAHGGPSDTIQCLLLHSSPDDIQYNALSYEWGEPRDDDPTIIVDGHETRIRRNLFECLKHVRFEDEDRYIWIDALSIDQSNTEERTHQVEMMGEIYRKAESVIVWVGPERDDSGFVMEEFSRPASLKKRSRSFEAAQFTAILAFCRRTYWRRIWVQQEMYLAKSYTIHCGTKCISDSDLDYSLGELVAPPPSEFEPEIGKSPAFSVIMRRRLRSMGTDLWGWLSVCTRMGVEMSEPRDLVYALLGVSVDCQNGEIVPDYNKSLTQLYRDTVELCQRTRSTRSSLYHSRGGASGIPILAQKFGLSVDDAGLPQAAPKATKPAKPRRKKGRRNRREKV